MTSIILALALTCVAPPGPCKADTQCCKCVNYSRQSYATCLEKERTKLGCEPFERERKNPNVPTCSERVEKKCLDLKLLAFQNCNSRKK